MAIEYTHNDKIGRTLEVGSCVAYSHFNNLYIGAVVRFTPKMVRLRAVGRNRGEHNKYPSDIVLLESPEVTLYLLKNS